MIFKNLLDPHYVKLPFDVNFVPLIKRNVSAPGFVYDTDMGSTTLIAGEFS